jgi:hypothetical protein
MIAIRQIQKVKSGSINISLPPDFDNKQVEIIILPIDEDNGKTLNIQALLLTAPTLTDDELRGFETVREWMNQWNVKDF